MNSKIYIDKKTPFAVLEEHSLSDGSKVWNIEIRGGETIPCVSERSAIKAFIGIGKALKDAGLEIFSL